MNKNAENSSVQRQHLFIGRHQSEVVVGENAFDTRPGTLQHVMSITLLQLTVLTYISHHHQHQQLQAESVCLSDTSGLVVVTKSLNIKPSWY